MKYSLRSASAEQDTNELSVPLPQIGFIKDTHKMKDNQKTAPKTKRVKKGSKNKSKRIQTQMNTHSKDSGSTHQTPLHESILRFPLKYKKKTLRVYCYKESDLEIKKRFQRCYMPHEKDDDQESWESLIEAEVERCKKDLFDSVRKYSEAKSQAQSEINKEVEASTDDSQKQSICKSKVIPKKGKKKISKRQKNKLKK